VRYADAAAFRAALEARLRQAATGDQDLARRRRTVAFDRFLARLAFRQGDAWILKGGAALEFRMPDRARSTRDIDLALTDSSDPADQLLDDLASDPFGDHFSFRVMSLGAGSCLRRRTEVPSSGCLSMRCSAVVSLSGLSSISSARTVRPPSYLSGSSWVGRSLSLICRSLNSPCSISERTGQRS
jgi:hypothetical protein